MRIDVGNKHVTITQPKTGKGFFLTFCEMNHTVAVTATELEALQTVLIDPLLIKEIKKQC